MFFFLLLLLFSFEFFIILNYTMFDIILWPISLIYYTYIIIFYHLYKFQHPNTLMYAINQVLYFTIFFLVNVEI
jgi:hypothetical protein